MNNLLLALSLTLLMAAAQFPASATPPGPETISQQNFQLTGSGMKFTQQELDRIFARAKLAQKENAARAFQDFPLSLAGRNLKHTGMVNYALTEFSHGPSSRYVLSVKATQPYSRWGMVKEAAKTGFNEQGFSAFRQALTGSRPQQTLTFWVKESGEVTVLSARAPLTAAAYRDTVSSVLKNLAVALSRLAIRVAVK